MQHKVYDKKRNRFYYIFFFLGLISIIWEIFIYRRTVIDLRLLLGIILIASTAATIIDFNSYCKTYGHKGIKTLCYALLQNTGSWGFILCWLFVAVNYYLADEVIVHETYQIIEKSSMSGSKHSREDRKPLVRIMYKGKKKELVFSHYYFEDLDDYKSVTIDIRDGFLGFDIVENQRLNK